MILIYENIEAISNYCEENRPDKDSVKPYFIPTQIEGGAWMLPEDRLVQSAIKETGLAHSYLTVINGTSVQIDFD